MEQFLYSSGEGWPADELALFPGNSGIDVLVTALGDRSNFTAAEARGSKKLVFTAAEGLASIGDTRSVAPLLEFVLHQDRGRWAVIKLKYLLESFPSNITETDLTVMANLDGVHQTRTVQVVPGDDPLFGYETIIEPVSCLEINRLARDELAKRKAVRD